MLEQQFPILCLLAVLTLAPSTGCLQSSQQQVVVFSALDRNFSEPVFDQFTSETQTQVLAKYDTESTKTVGLANQIMQADATPACDVFWNNEILHTLRLEAAGKLQPLPDALLANYPSSAQSPSKHWVGLAARARVIIINSDLLPDPQQWPSSIEDLAKPKWKGQACLAKPLFGTTATHFAVLYQQWGDQRFQQFVQQLKSNQVGILSGNRQVAADVAAGKYAFGFTDTDDFHLEYLAGSPVKLIWPDQGQDDMGTLLLPNTLCITANASHPQQAEILVQYLLSGAIEKQLAEGTSAQLPLRSDISVKPKLFPDPLPKWQEVSWNNTVEAWNQSSQILKEAFY